MIHSPAGISAAVSAADAGASVLLVEEEYQDDVDTLGGLVFSLLGRVPLRGELVLAHLTIQVPSTRAHAMDVLEKLAGGESYGTHPARWRAWIQTL